MHAISRYEYGVLAFMCVCVFRWACAFGVLHNRAFYGVPAVLACNLPSHYFVG